MELLVRTHDVLMTVACALLAKDHLQRCFPLILFFFLDSPRHCCHATLVLDERREFHMGPVVIFCILSCVVSNDLVCLIAGVVLCYCGMQYLVIKVAYVTLLSIK